MVWLRKAADQDNWRAETDLGWMYQYGQGVTQNYAESLILFRKAADVKFTYSLNGKAVTVQVGDARAQTNLGLMYEFGIGVAKDDREATVWFRKAADQGFAEAQNDLGNMYSSGRGVPQDDKEAVIWFRKAADQWFSEALNNLGNMYLSGRGVAQDDKEAVTYFRKAAVLESALGQRNLARMYFLRRGVVQDDQKAVEWLQKAASLKTIHVYNADSVSIKTTDTKIHKLKTHLGGAMLGHEYSYRPAVLQREYVVINSGNAESQIDLGLMYLYGRGVAQDVKQAEIWIRKAANQGEVNSQTMLAQWYENGAIAIRQDAEKAYFWFFLSSLKGNPEGIDGCNRIKKNLTPEKINVIEAQARSWSPIYSLSPDT